MLIKKSPNRNGDFGWGERGIKRPGGLDNLRDKMPGDTRRSYHRADEIYKNTSCQEVNVNRSENKKRPGDGDDRRAD